MLMRALYRAGRHAEALEVFREGRHFSTASSGSSRVRSCASSSVRSSGKIRRSPSTEAAPAVSAREPRGCGRARGRGGRPRVSGGGCLQRAIAHGTSCSPGSSPASERHPGDGTARRSPAQSRCRRDVDPCRRLLLDRTRGRRGAARPPAGCRHAAARSAGDPLTGPLASAFDAATCDVASLVEGGGGSPTGQSSSRSEHSSTTGLHSSSACGSLLRSVGRCGSSERQTGAERATPAACSPTRRSSSSTSRASSPSRCSDDRVARRRGPGRGGRLARGRVSPSAGARKGSAPLVRALVDEPVAPTVLVRRGLRPGGIAPTDTLTRFTWSIHSPESEVQVPEVGSQLAGYRIEGMIGRGGMGVVYLATELALDRPVALKLDRARAGGRRDVPAALPPGVEDRRLHRSRRHPAGVRSGRIGRAALHCEPLRRRHRSTDGARRTGRSSRHVRWGWSVRWRTRSMRRTSAGSCTGTSSPETSSSTGSITATSATSA